MAFFSLDFDSTILGRRETILVAAPEHPDNSAVLYLLHGGGGGGGVDNRSWLPQKDRLSRWAETYGVTILMPSAPDSFFANTCGGVRYQDFMLEEFCREMPERLGLSRAREETAVAGMSMGGTSAFRLGLAAPERFGWIGCLSSGNLWTSDLSNRVHAYAVKNVFGVERIQDIEGTEYDFFADALRDVREGRPLPVIFHACGGEDHALEHARPTAKWFAEHGTAFDYHYFEPEKGGHTDDFFRVWMERFLQFFRGQISAEAIEAEMNRAE